MQLGYIGLGKMGANMVERLLEKGHEVVVYDMSEEAVAQAAQRGARPVGSLEDMMRDLRPPRLVWIMVPHKAVEGLLEELSPHLQEGDVVIEGGNSLYKDSMRRAEELTAKGVAMLDVGVSGGPHGARNGACMMIGGAQEVYEAHERLFADLCVDHGFAYVGASGAGHFVKMAHNGIEYGMMQSIAEGFDIMRNAPFTLSLSNIADVYNHGSVIESRLMGWLHDGLQHYGEDLAGISGRAGASGEGAWTVEAAHELSVRADGIADALRARRRFQDEPDYQGQIISLLRHQFGGHEVRREVSQD